MGEKHILFTKIGSNTISLMNKDNLETQVDMEYDEKGATILGIDVNPDFTEYCVLMEIAEVADDKKSKKASLGYVKDGILEDFDVFELPE